LSWRKIFLVPNLKFSRPESWVYFRSSNYILIMKKITQVSGGSNTQADVRIIFDGSISHNNGLTYFNINMCTIDSIGHVRLRSTLIDISPESVNGKYLFWQDKRGSLNGSFDENVEVARISLEDFASVGKLEVVGQTMRLRFHNTSVDLDLADYSINDKLWIRKYSNNLYLGFVNDDYLLDASSHQDNPIALKGKIELDLTYVIFSLKKFHKKLGVRYSPALF
jgi:hypothetical protein